MASTREVAIQDRLYTIISSFIGKYKIGGIELTVEREYPVDNKRIDIAVLVKDKQIPILIIETKRKYIERDTYRTSPKITPLSRSVIGQALCYAKFVKDSLGLYKTPFFATANIDGIFVFSPIEDPGAFVDVNACRDGRYEDAIKPGKYNELQKYRFRYYRPTESEVQTMIDNVASSWLNTEAIGQLRVNLGNWFIEQLRLGFIEALLNIYGVGDYLKSELSRDSSYWSRLDELARSHGYKNGLADIVGKNLETVDNLARMMLYVLMNKIIFYKVLETHYKLPQLKPFCASVNYSTNKYLQTLRNYFNNVLIVTQDFEPIFTTGLFDELRLPDDPEVCRVIDDLIHLVDEVGAINIGDIIGYIYEQLIPAEERHRLGQFYTPPAIARLIVKWSARKPTDVILDPGCGSGTFLIEAYPRLYELKTGKTLREGRPSREIHEAILSQLYGVDINPFPLHLTAVNLAMRNARNPSSNMNVIHQDFFTILPEQQVLAGYTTVTINGVRPRCIPLPKTFDAVIGNPPYTRWVEIPDKTQRMILQNLLPQFPTYDLRPDPNRGREPGIYVYWVMHATRFLKEGGRLGMIISNMWMQTDYGIEFGKFLLDNYKIKALVDVSYRLFTALISTVIILAERAGDEKERAQNKVLLVRVPPIDSKLSNADVEKRLEQVFDCLAKTIDEGTYEFSETKLKECSKLGVWYRFIEQGQMPKDRKWIGLFFGGVDVVNSLEELANEGKLMIRASEWFKPSRGNSVWSIWALDHGRRPDIGAKEFFYFGEGKIDKWQEVHGQFGSKIIDCLAPAITRSQWIKTFTFTRDDWEELRRGGKDVYLFICHKPRGELPSEVAEYVRWGESGECRTKIRGTRGGGRKCSEAVACKAREGARRWFYGWYDLGGYVPTPIMAVRQARYRPQFFLVKMPLVTYDAIVTFIPRVRVRVGGWVFDPGEYKGVIGEVNSNVELDEVEVKALLAYLNSTFNWLWLEQNARYVAKGPLGLEVNIAERMPILNVKAIDRGRVEELAKLFDELEAEARRLMGLKPVTNDPPGDEEGEEEEGVGGPKLEMFRQLRPIFGKIDAKIAEVLGIDIDVDALWGQAWEMMERRVKGAERVARPGAPPMAEEKSGEGRRKRKKGGGSAPLTSFF
jgi:type I restriction-modification system DNA methylase subunit